MHLSNKDYLESRLQIRSHGSTLPLLIRRVTWKQESWHLQCTAANLGARTSIHGALVTFHLRSQTIWESGRLNSMIRYGKTFYWGKVFCCLLSRFAFTSSKSCKCILLAPRPSSGNFESSIVYKTIIVFVYLVSWSFPFKYSAQFIRFLRVEQISNLLNVSLFAQCLHKYVLVSNYSLANVSR